MKYRVKPGMGFEIVKDAAPHNKPGCKFIEGKDYNEKDLPEAPCFRARFEPVKRRKGKGADNANITE